MKTMTVLKSLREEPEAAAQDALDLYNKNDLQMMGEFETTH